jgi:hypothetical protein
MEEVKLTNNYDVIVFNVIRQRFIEKMNELNIDFQEKDYLALDIMINALINRDLDRNKNVYVVNAGCGMGKSVLIEIYVNYMLEKHGKENYGAVIARERVEDVMQMSARNDGYYPLYGFKAEDCLEKYDTYNPNLCRACTQMECRVKQNMELSKTYPVLVTTHKRVQLAENLPYLQPQLYSYTAFENDKPKEIRRYDLFIDENPDFYELRSIHMLDLDDFKDELKLTYKRDCKGKEALVNYFSNLIDNLKGILVENYEEYFDGFVNKSNYLEFAKHENNFKENYYGHNFVKCLDVLSVLKYGGKKISNTKVTFPTFRSLSGLPFNIMIFDATASINKNYTYNCKLIKVPETRIFNNLTININNKHNLSKSYYKENANFPVRVAEEIKKSLDEHECVLIVTFQDIEKVYHELFRDEINQGRILLAHVNATKGRNDLHRATCIYVLYSLYKTDNYYLMGMKDGLKIDPNKIIFDNIDSKRQPMYIKEDKTVALCNEVYDFMVHDKAKDLVQEIFRTKARIYNFDGKVEVFIFNTDENIIDCINPYFNGATIQPWNATDTRKKSEQLDQYMNAVNSEFSGKQDGYMISLKDFKNKHFIKERSFRNYQKMSEVLDLYQLLHVQRKGNFFVVIN